MPPRSSESSPNDIPPPEPAAAPQLHSEIRAENRAGLKARPYEVVPADWKRGFWSLIATQFQAAFSDNVLKWVVSFIVLDMAIPQEQRDRLFVLIIPLLFSIPFLLFSMTGGYFADHYSKRSVAIGTKFFEIAVAMLAVAGLALRSLPIECAAVFLISTQGALFGPTKYGLLPELLPEPQAFLGQRNSGTGNVPGDFDWDAGRRRTVLCFSRAGILVGRDFDRLGARRTFDQPRNFALARGTAHEPLPLESSRRPVGPDRIDSQRSRADTGSDRQYLFLVSRLAPAAERSAVCERRAPRERRAHQPAAWDSVDWNWNRKFRGRISFGKQNRIWIDSPGHDRNDDRFGPPLSARPFLHRRRDPAKHLGIFRWILRCADQCLDSAPTGSCHERRDSSRGEFAFIRGDCRAADRAVRHDFCGPSKSCHGVSDLFGDDAGRDRLCLLDATGCAAAAFAVDGDAHFLQDSRGWARKYSGARRGAVCRQSSFVGGRAAFDCGVRPANPIHDFRGYLQLSGSEAVCLDSACDSDFVDAAAARFDSRAAHSVRRDSQR